MNAPEDHKLFTLAHVEVDTGLERERERALHVGFTFIEHFRFLHIQAIYTGT